MDTPIPAHNGRHPINGLPVQHHCAVVFDRQTLSILDVTATHNAAQEVANSLFVEQAIDALAGELRFYDPNLTPAMLRGMTLDQFADFIDNNRQHPLIAGSTQ